MKQLLDKNHLVARILKAYKKSELNFRAEEYTTYKEDGGIVEIKIDGELTGLFYDREAITVSIGGRIRWDYPVTEEAKRILKRWKRSLFVGELYVVDDKGSPIPYPKAISVLRKPSPDSEKRIRLALFDVLIFDGKRVDDDYSDRFALVKTIFSKGKYVYPILSGKSVKELWKLVTHQGYEGVVIRKNDIIKIKPRFDVDAAVIAITSDKEGQMSALHLALMDRKKRFRYIGKVGTGFKLQERQQWLKWAMANRAGGPQKGPFRKAIWVKPMRVVEVKYHRLNKAETPALVYSGGEYKEIGKLPCVTIAGAFSRIRDDKSVQPSDLRLSQIPGLSSE